MTDKELLELYKNSNELMPSPDLKSKIISRATVELNGRKKAKNVQVRGIRLRKLLPIAICCLVLLSMIGAMFGFKYENYQTVYIDVNPSISISINRFDYVNGFDCINDDAQELIESTSLKGLKIEEALEKVIELFDEKNYFDEQADLYISVSSKSDKSAEKLLAKLCKKAEQVKGNKKYSVNTEKLTKEEKEDAKELGISAGKLRVIKQVIEKYPNLTIEDLKDKTMSELKNMLKD